MPDEECSVLLLILAGILVALAFAYESELYMLLLGSALTHKEIIAKYSALKL